MRKSPKAKNIESLLRKGMTTKEITERMAVSPSYIWTVKKKMAEEERNGRPCKNDCGPAVEATNVDAILDERGSRYGSFMFGANIAIRLKGVMHNAIAQKDLHLAPDQMLALDMIAVKISRILSGNPSHKDSWVDIAGYAQLVVDRLQGKER